MIEVLCLALTIYWVICIARIVLSFIPIEAGGYLATGQTLIYKLTEPVFGAVRQVLPRPGDLPIDLSPLVVFLVIALLRGLLGC